MLRTVRCIQSSPTYSACCSLHATMLPPQSWRNSSTQPLSLPSGRYRSLVGCLIVVATPSGFAALESESPETETEDTRSLSGLDYGRVRAASGVLHVGRPALGGPHHTGDAAPLPGT